MGSAFCLRLANHKEIEVDSGLVKAWVAGQTGGETFLDVVKLNRRQAGRVEGQNESSHSKCKNAKVLICRCWSECMNYVCVCVVCMCSV